MRAECARASIILGSDAFLGPDMYVYEFSPSQMQLFYLFIYFPPLPFPVFYLANWVFYYLFYFFEFLSVHISLISRKPWRYTNRPSNPRASTTSRSTRPSRTSSMRASGSPPPRVRRLRYLTFTFFLSLLLHTALASCFSLSLLRLFPSSYQFFIYYLFCAQFAGAYLSEALLMCERWGAVVKSRQIRMHYASVLATNGGLLVGETQKVNPMTLRESQAFSLDLDTVIQISQTISNEVC